MWEVLLSSCNGIEDRLSWHRFPRSIPLRWWCHLMNRGSELAGDVAWSPLFSAAHFLLDIFVLNKLWPWRRTLLHMGLMVAVASEALSWTANLVHLTSIWLTGYPAFSSLVVAQALASLSFAVLSAVALLAGSARSAQREAIIAAAVFAFVQLVLGAIFGWSICQGLYIERLRVQGLDQSGQGEVLRFFLAGFMLAFVLVLEPELQSCDLFLGLTSRGPKEDCNELVEAGRLQNPETGRRQAATQVAAAGRRRAPRKQPHQQQQQLRYAPRRYAGWRARSIVLVLLGHLGVRLVCSLVSIHARPAIGSLLHLCVASATYASLLRCVD